ncbi:MAG: hypothetical protein J3Q66DRAFT_170561 [Benniella sp.]|nr:MAG: hypothetical protein J3Q66DRAFT_170561 [Benniella sp.]
MRRIFISIHIHTLSFAILCTDILYFPTNFVLSHTLSHSHSLTHSLTTLATTTTRTMLCLGPICVSFTVSFFFFFLLAFRFVSCTITSPLSKEKIKWRGQHSSAHRYIKRRAFDRIK